MKEYDPLNMWCMVETDLMAIDILVQQGNMEKAKHRIQQTLKGVRRLKKRNGEQLDKSDKRP